VWIVGIGWRRLLSIWEFIIPASAGLSDELNTSVAGGQECNIARPDPNRLANKVQLRANYLISKQRIV